MVLILGHKVHRATSQDLFNNFQAFKWAWSAITYQHLYWYPWLPAQLFPGARTVQSSLISGYGPKKLKNQGLIPGRGKKVFSPPWHPEWLWGPFTPQHIGTRVEAEV
jgi:hypothetical protein